MSEKNEKPKTKTEVEVLQKVVVLTVGDGDQKITLQFPVGKGLGVQVPQCVSTLFGAEPSPTIEMSVVTRKVIEYV